MRYGSVYLLTNKRTKEQYVGQTIKSVERRWYAHCVAAKHPNGGISSNIADYGSDAFSVQDMFVVFSKTDLNWAEQLFIAQLKPTLNRTKGGAGSPRTHSAVECKRQSEAAKRRWADPEWRAKTVASLKAATRPVVPYEILRARGVAACEKRWAQHVKKEKVFVDKGALTSQTWQDATIRAKRIDGIRKACERPEVRQKKQLASTGRVMERAAVEKSAQAKWKPVYCPELQVSFLSQTHAADFLNVLRTSVCNAINRKGKVNKQFTLLRVS